MTTEKKHSTLVEEVQNRLRQLSPKRLEAAIAFLAYLQETEENKITEELLGIPGFAASYREGVQLKPQEQANLSSHNNKVDALGDNNPRMIAQDAKVWEAYLAIEQKWEEVFRRLADS